MASVKQWPELQRFFQAAWNVHYCLGRSEGELADARKEFSDARLALTIAIGVDRAVDSPSSLNTYKNCPRQYLLEYSDEDERDRSTASIENVVGSAVHDTIEAFSTGSNINSNKDAIALCKGRLSYHLGKSKVISPKPERNVEWAMETAETCITNWWEFYQHLLEIGAKNFRYEEMVKFPGEPRVRGYADFVYEVDDKVVCLDWKTGRLPFRGFRGSSVQKQVRIYGSALRLNGETRPIVVCAEYLAHNKTYSEPLTDEAVEATLAYCIRTRNEIRNEEEWDANTGPLCRWCAFSRPANNEPAQCGEGERYVNAD